MSDPTVESLIETINQIDLMLRQANCILMLSQPRKSGRITLWLPERIGRFGIPASPRLVQWKHNKQRHTWHPRSIPATHLSKRAKGAQEFAAGYHTTTATLEKIALLLEQRARVVALLRSFGIKAANFYAAFNKVAEPTDTDLKRLFVEQSQYRRNTNPTPEEVAWYLSGGTTPLSGEEGLAIDMTGSDLEEDDDV